MKQYLIIILLLLSACAPKHVDLPKVYQDTKFQQLKESFAKLYASSPKGQIYMNAQQGTAYMK